jgi:arabinofuranosyltransferase
MSTRPKKRTQPVEAKPRRRSHATARLCILLGAALVALVVGWRLFWFLTDDSFISFRYASNGHLGYGYVWNFPPFRPVEGYTNFLWILLLDGVWRLTHVEPPVSANYISLGFSFLTLVLVSAMTQRLKWRTELRPHALVFVGLGLAFLLANRTFLAWTSSGLETAMFTFLVIAWVFSVLELGASLVRPAFLAAASAALLELTRPDGLLYALVTLALLAYLFARNRRSLKPVHYLAAAPLLSVPIHFAWRLHMYGSWLPNSYYAKQVAWWPASGARYALSFILEYALWAWIALALFVALGKGLAGAPRKRPAVTQLAAIAALLGHFLYYTIVVGGDHFEYRVYNHLLVLVPFSFLWLLNRTSWRTSRAAAAMIIFIGLSLPVPWTHWSYSHNLVTRDETAAMKVAVAPHWPAFARWYANAFDRLQFNLIDHSVCIRHQEHKVCYEYLVETYPTREEGLSMAGDGYPVHVAAAVGVASWVLPRVNIIDVLGLNDYVIARLPVPAEDARHMAHDRQAPKDYVFCFYPNVFIDRGRAIVRDRKVPLTPEQIVKCETQWRRHVDNFGKE